MGAAGAGSRWWPPRWASAVAVLALTLTACAGFPELQGPAQAEPSTSELGAKISRLEQAVAELQRGSRPSAPDPDLARRADELGKSVAELRQRLEAAESQMLKVQERSEQLERARRTDDSRGRLEEVQASVQRLSTKLQEMETRLARTPPAPTPGPGPAPAPNGTVAAGPAPDKKPSPQALYEEGYALLKQSKPEQAREKMAEFLRLYPEGPLAPNACFWIGESYYDQKQYEQAILEYDKVIQKFPKSEKVPSALLKQAFAFDAINDPADAKILLRKILREHPSSDQAAIAKKKLEALGE